MDLKKTMAINEAGMPLPNLIHLARFRIEIIRVNCKKACRTWNICRMNTLAVHLSAKALTMKQ